LIELIAFGKTKCFGTTDTTKSLGIDMHTKRALLGVWILGYWVLGIVKLEC
jgi:hypothetical protein